MTKLAKAVDYQAVKRAQIIKTKIIKILAKITVYKSMVIISQQLAFTQRKTSNTSELLFSNMLNKGLQVNNR